MASARVVLPEELCPTRTMLRMSLLSYLGIRDPPAARKLGAACATSEGPGPSQGRKDQNDVDCIPAPAEVSNERPELGSEAHRIVVRHSSRPLRIESGAGNSRSSLRWIGPGSMQSIAHRMENGGPLSRNRDAGAVGITKNPGGVAALPGRNCPGFR